MESSGKRILTLALAGVAMLVGVLSCIPEGGGFDSQSGHLLGFYPWLEQVWEVAWLMFLSHMDFSLSPPLSKIVFLKKEYSL